MSEPVHTGSMSHASAAAEPPEDPPAFRLGSKGLPVAPHTGLRVLAPAPSSGTFVLAVRMPPARRSRATSSTSCSGTKLRKLGEPKVVSSPAVASRSFTPSGRPCSRPSGSPRMTARSASLACSRACSKQVAVTAFTSGFSFSIRAMQASSSSTGEMAFVPIMRRSSGAECSTREEGAGVRLMGKDGNRGNAWMLGSGLTCINGNP